MSFSLDLNFPPSNNETDFIFSLEDEREGLFDLNQSPPNEEGFDNEDFEFSYGNNVDVELPIDNDSNDEEHIEYIDQEIDHGNQPHKKKKNLSNKERWMVYSALMAKTNGGKKEKTTTREVSDLLAIPIATVNRIWNRAKETSDNIGYVDVSHKRSGTCGKKKISLDITKILDTPLQQRTTLRSLSASLGVSPATLYRRVEEGVIRRHSNAIKPCLTEENKKKRLQFCLSMLDKDTLLNEPKFIDMYNIVHIDEKWFYMTKKMQKYYLLPAEEDPYRTCQSKNFITKVMFFVAMARPRFDEEGNEVFSGKIGVFPFVSLEPAKRRSKHRDAGTLEWKASTSVKREDIRACLINKVIPVIHERWPSEDRGKTIFIQQDNARTHVDIGDKEFEEAATKNGFDIRLMCQPPNSPDLNILDLGFFSAIQSIQHKACPKNVEELVQAVEKSFVEYPPTKVNYIFLTLQTCMKEIMKVGGSHKYKIEHTQKATLEREGRLPIQISCDASLVENVMNILATTS